MNPMNGDRDGWAFETSPGIWSWSLGRPYTKKEAEELASEYSGDGFTARVAPKYENCRPNWLPVCGDDFIEAFHESVWENFPYMITSSYEEDCIEILDLEPSDVEELEQALLAAWMRWLKKRRTNAVFIDEDAK